MAEPLDPDTLADLRVSAEKVKAARDRGGFAYVAADPDVMLALLAVARDHARLTAENGCYELALNTITQQVGCPGVCVPVILARNALADAKGLR